MPGPVASHRMACQIRPLWIGLESLASQFKDFESVPTSPVLPVKAVIATVRRRDHIRVVLGAVDGGLSLSFHARTMQRQDHARGSIGSQGALFRRDHTVVLNASVDLTDERATMHLLRGPHRPLDFDLIELVSSG